MNTEIIPVPKNFIIQENFGELQIEFKWNRTMGIVFLVFSLIWNALLIFMISQMPAEIWYFSLIHAAAGLFILYLGLSNLLNKTLITCTNDTLKLKSGPIPNFNNKEIAKDEVSQLYFTEQINRGKNGSTTITYRLHMLDKNNRSIKLIKTLPDAESARYIETKLEKFFKIKNLGVAGEFDRKN